MTETELLRRKLEREIKARKEAERITEEKTREIYYKNIELRALNENLEMLVAARTFELAKAHDKAIEANRIKSQFLANMSHELRTPLNAIIGYSELLIEEADEREDQILSEDLNRIYQSGKHLLTLINDILDISKIESGKFDLHYEYTDVRNLCHHVLDTVKPLIDANQNELFVDFEEGMMSTDSMKLRQILINLLGNAAKFTIKGRIFFQAKYESKDGVPGYLFSIRDTGIGFASEQLPKLFEPFTQADSTTTRKFGGTGLGLAISQEFANMLGGHIDASSTEHEGSIFTCSLPAEHVEAKDLSMKSDFEES